MPTTITRHKIAVPEIGWAALDHPVLYSFQLRTTHNNWNVTCSVPGFSIKFSSREHCVTFLLCKIETVTQNPWRWWVQIMEIDAKEYAHRYLVFLWFMVGGMMMRTRARCCVTCFRRPSLAAKQWQIAALLHYVLTCLYVDQPVTESVSQSASQPDTHPPGSWVCGVIRCGGCGSRIVKRGSKGEWVVDG